MNYKVENHGLYRLVTFKELNSYGCKKWRCNREPAECKIDEISRKEKM